MPKPGKITLESGATHFSCAGCGSVKPVTVGVYKGLVAYSLGDDIESRHYIKWRLLCKECYTGKKEEVKDKKSERKIKTR